MIFKLKHHQWCLLLALVLVGGCKGGSPKDTQEVVEQEVRHLQAQIRKTIKDPQRADVAVAIVDTMPQHLMRAADAQIQLEKKLETLFPNYESTREDYASALRKNREERKISHQALLKMRVQLSSITTDKEWAGLAKAREKVFRSYLQSVRSRM